MFLRLRRLVVLVVGLVLATNAGRVDAADGDRWAQLASPVFRNYGSDEGLPNLVVTAIAQSADGFLWIGTQGGLARWDGYRFRVYRPAAGDAGALPDSWITVIHSDASGRLWIGTNAGGLARYVRNLDRFITYGVRSGALSNAHIWAIADDGGQGIWVASDGGLDHVLASGRTTNTHHRAHDPTSLPDDRVRALVRDASGTLWVGTATGLVTTRSSGPFQRVSFGGASSVSTEVSSLIEDRNGEVWIGTAHHGAFVVGPRGRVARPVRETTDEAPRAASEDLSSDGVFAMTLAGPNDVWLGTWGQGIVAVNTKTGRTHRIMYDGLVRKSLADNSIWALYEDRVGGLWVGTDQGLDLLGSDTRGAVATVFGGTSNPRGLSEDNVLSVSVAANGRVWAGLLGKGIDILDPLQARVKNVAPDSTKPDSALPKTGVVSLAERTNGEMFVGSRFGLYRVDSTGARVTRVRLPGRDPAAGTIWIYRSAGRLWVVGDDGIWSVKADRAARAPVEHFNSGRLTDRNATMVTNSSAGDLWIGTSNGLNRLDRSSGKIERIFANPADPKALPNGFVTTLLVDRFGRLWAGTEGGIGVLVRRTAGRPIFKRIGTEQGLPDDNVDMLLADRAGRVWAATDNGIAVIDPVDFSIHTLQRAEGLAILAYWNGSGATTKEGELLFGGAGGLTVIRPDRFRPWTYHPPVVVTQAMVGGKLVQTEDGSPLLVRPDANSLAVEFSALDYSAPERNRYAYRLDGFDRDWVTTDATRRLAAYTNLAPGTYTLHLRGSNRLGEWTEATVNLPIRVLPAWYQTALFKIAIALLSATGVALLVQARTAYIRRRQRELEQQVAARTLELKESTLKLEARTLELEESTLELKESKFQIEQIAYHDALTGLPNRRLFTDEFEKLIARGRRQGPPFALLLIDLDRFKQINDTLGHDAGDALLVEAAKRMQASLRVSDRLVRLGGDEFAILINDGADDHDAMNEVCRRIVRCFETVVPFSGAEMKTSASIGIAAYPEHGGTSEALFKAADLALYEAKRAGRNTWRWCQSGVASSPR